MVDKKHISAYAELKQYEDELQNPKVTERKEVIREIEEVREQGDLSEDAEYDTTEDKQRDIELRIEELEKLLRNAEVVIGDEIDLNKINIGYKIKPLNVECDEGMKFYIVGSTEANSLQNKISNESPAGHALTGEVVGKRVDMETQAGDIQYKVLEIQRAS